MAQAGARLVEVGITNRTRLGDHAAAIGPATGAVLRVHPSNVRVVGFAEKVAVESLCELGVPVVDDVGSRQLGGRAASRRCAQALLEHLDAARVTRRLPDDRRVLRPRRAAERPHRGAGSFLHPMGAR